jgi:hypothetical protein
VVRPHLAQARRNVKIASHNSSTNQPGRRLSAKSVHVLDKSAQLCKVLRDLGCSDECAFAAMNLDKAAAHKILNSPTNGNPADPESRSEAVFGRELVTDLQVSSLITLARAVSTRE